MGNKRRKKKNMKKKKNRNLVAKDLRENPLYRKKVFTDRKKRDKMTHKEDR